MFGKNPVATFKAVKLRPPVYKPEEEATYEANTIVNSLKIWVRGSWVEWDSLFHNFKKYDLINWDTWPIDCW